MKSNKKKKNAIESACISEIMHIPILLKILYKMGKQTAHAVRL